MPFRAGQLGRRTVRRHKCTPATKKIHGQLISLKNHGVSGTGGSTYLSESGHAGGIENSEWAKYLYKKHLNTHIPTSAIAESWVFTLGPSGDVHM